MDPSIMKFLEEDEDESMHCGAAVDALTAALNRDIARDTSTSQYSDSDSASFCQESNHLFAQWQSYIHDANADGHKMQDLNGSRQQEQQSSKIELKHHGSGPQNLQIDAHFSKTMLTPISEKNPIPIIELDRGKNLGTSQFSKNMTNQRTIAGEQAMNSVKSGKQVPFGKLLPILVPQLDKERGMQLNSLYMRLKKNEISKLDFVRLMKAIVGDHMLKMAVCKVQVQAQKTQTRPNQLSLQSQASTQAQHLQMPSIGANQGTVPLSHVPSSSAVQQTSHSTNAMATSNVQKSPEMERKSDLSGMPTSQTSISRLSNINQEWEHPTIPIQGLSKLQQQHLHFSQFSIDGNKSVNCHQFSGANVSSTASSVRQQPHDSLMRQGPTQSNSLIPSASSLAGSKSSQETPMIKTFMGHQKPLESLCSLQPPPSKKEKVSGPSMDESIEQLNDVTAVSGVNLREEEEQLFSGPKEDNQVSEASRRVVQEEEERLILQNIPLREKVAEIIEKCGLKTTSNDVERCLSLCVEERLRGLISNLIRLSKQRVDLEKPRHRILITSDFQQHITAINQKARAGLDKKLTEVEKVQKLYEPEGDVDEDKHEGRVKSFKANEDDDDKMRTAAANVAARAAVGGDDMLSKWQLMAEQARQKHGGRGNQEAEKRGNQFDAMTSGLSRKFTRNQGMVPHSKVNPSISIKDVISALEREPQMSKTTLMRHLYDKARANAVVG